jgi:hypothetical protein
MEIGMTGNIEGSSAGPLTSDELKLAQRRKIAEWLEGKWPQPRRCPICSQNNWNIGDLVEVRPYNAGALVVGGPLYPLFPVTCLVCGYTLLFNALIARVIGGDQA